MKRIIIEFPPGEYLLRGPIRIYGEDVVVSGAAVGADHHDIEELVDEAPDDQDALTGTAE